MFISNHEPQRVLVATAASLAVLFAVFSIGARAAVAGPPSSRADHWTPQERTVLESMSLASLAPPAADPSNAVATRAEAAALGQRLFADTRFSANGQVACASCHVRELQFQDGRPVGRGIAEGRRRTMPIAGSVYGAWFFWDGRKDSAWSQALGPLEDALEHGSNRMAIARTLQAHYRPEYEAIFGPLPDLAGLPADASPLGDAQQQAAWQRIPVARREAVNRVFANLGKAIAAYERTLVPTESRFDRYVQAVLRADAAAMAALSREEVAGLRLFIGKGQCSSCHDGPLMTDQAFHNTGVPARVGSQPDRGRASATAKVLGDEFNCLGRYSDARPEHCAELRFMSTDDPGLLGAFKTPGLRDVALRAPYMHTGQFATLEAAVAHYSRSPEAAVGHSELARAGEQRAERAPIRLSDGELRQLVAFLRALSSAPAGGG